MSHFSNACHLCAQIWTKEAKKKKKTNFVENVEIRLVIAKNYALNNYYGSLETFFFIIRLLMEVSLIHFKIFACLPAFHLLYNQELNNCTYINNSFTIQA